MSGTVPPSGKATVDALADHWGTLFAAYLFREGIKEVIIAEPELLQISSDPGKPTIVVQELQDGLHIKILPLQEAIALAEKNKGGFGRS